MRRAKLVTQHRGPEPTVPHTSYICTLHTHKYIYTYTHTELYFVKKKILLISFKITQKFTVSSLVTHTRIMKRIIHLGNEFQSHLHQNCSIRRQGEPAFQKIPSFRKRVNSHKLGQVFAIVIANILSILCVPRTLHTLLDIIFSCTAVILVPYFTDQEPRGQQVNNCD